MTTEAFGTLVCKECDHVEEIHADEELRCPECGASSVVVGRNEEEVREYLEACREPDLAPDSGERGETYQETLLKGARDKIEAFVHGEKNDQLLWSARDTLNTAIRILADRPSSTEAGEEEDPEPGHDVRRWAEGLICQLPEDHDGRNSWLLNYGLSEEAEQLREDHPYGDEALKIRRPDPSTASEGPDPGDCYCHGCESYHRPTEPCRDPAPMERETTSASRETADCEGVAPSSPRRKTGVEPPVHGGRPGHDEKLPTSPHTWTDDELAGALWRMSSIEQFDDVRIQEAARRLADAARLEGEGRGLRIDCDSCDESFRSEGEYEVQCPSCDELGAVVRCLEGEEVVAEGIIHRESDGTLRTSLKDRPSLDLEPGEWVPISILFRRREGGESGD